MSITVHEFDGISRQFRMKPHEMPVMSTPTSTPNYTTIKTFELALRENALAIPSYQTHLGHLALVISPEEFLEVNNNADHTLNEQRMKASWNQPAPLMNSNLDKHSRLKAMK